MRTRIPGLFGGIVLIALGVIFLLENLAIIQVGDLFWGAMMAAGGLFFLGWFIQARKHWWLLIPGLALLSLSTLSFLENLAPHMAGRWGGSLVLGGIGLSFLLVYLSSRTHWWAIIPGGVMITLAVVAYLDETAVGFDTGGIFFIGLGLTFAAVAIAPNPEGAMRWAWIPALVLIVFGALIFINAEKLLEYLGPAGLILAGIYLVYRVMRASTKEEEIK